MRHISIHAFVWLFSCLPALVLGQSVYKQVDKDGKTTYSDQRAAKEGKPLEIDSDRNVTQSAKDKGTGSKALSIEEHVKQRRELRDTLRAAIEQAQAALDVAREALAKGQEPREDEWQPTVSNADNAGKPNASGVITGRNGQVVCSKVKGPDGSNRVLCPAVQVPGEAFRDRFKALEDAVAKAEESLREAEQNYRRNAPD